MADLQWGARSPLRVLVALAVALVYGLLAAVQNSGHPFQVATNLLVASCLILIALRDGRLITSGDQLRVSGALRTRDVVRAREIAGIVRSTEMPWTLTIWTLDGRSITVAASRNGLREKDPVQRRLDELEAWFIEHRGPDWSLDALQAA